MMKVRTKRSIRILLSALLVLVMVFQSLAAPVSYAGPTAASEPAKVTGTWSKDAAGNWNFNAQDGAAKDGWYYLNTTNKATDYNWFHFTNGVMNTGWIQDKTDLSVWYYTGETKDSSEGGMVKGWATDPRDGKRYYMDPSTGIMRYGWQLIGNVWYYFGEKQYANASHPYGAMYVNERTPDGYYVGSNGGWIQNHSENDSDDPVGPVVVPVTGVSLDKSEVTLVVGDTCTLNAAVAPASATNKNVKWSSSDSTVATVDAAGKATAVAEGTATITVTTVDGGKTATCIVTVTKTIADILGTVSGGFPEEQNAWVADTGYKCFINDTSSELRFRDTSGYGYDIGVSEPVTKDGDNYVYEANWAKISFTMDSDSLISITWYSSDTGYKDYNGTYKAPASELKYIKDVLATVEGNFPTSASQDPPTDAWVDTNGNKCYVYNEMLNFYNAIDKGYDVSVQYGEVTKSGDNYIFEDAATKITFTMDNGKLKNIVFSDANRQYCEGTYAPVVPVTGVTLDKSEVTLGEGDTCTLSATVAPANATNKNVTWSSSDSTVAAVDAAGVVTAVAAGEAVITVTTVDGGKTATCTVTVTAPAVITIAEVLATVDSFPQMKDGDDDPADGAWEATGTDSKTGEPWTKQCYLTCDGNSLRFKFVERYKNIDTSSAVSQDDENYVYTDSDITITFTMSEEVLSSITFADETTDTWDGTYEKPACIAAGTMISMPEGRQKAVEDLEIGDIVCTFDHETGEVSSAPVVFIWESKNAGNAFTLTFEGGIEVTVIEEHGFYDQEEQKYAFINLQNAKDYIGHHFYHADTNNWLELESCEAMNDRVDAYAIITSGDLNHMSNGMLSMCDGTIKVLANLFVYDDQMKFDAEKKKADIETWGLTPIEKVLELEGFIEADYDDYNLQYVDIMIGKGLITWEWMEALSDYCVANGWVSDTSTNEVSTTETEEKDPVTEEPILGSKGTGEKAEPEKDLGIPVEALETEIPEAVVPEIAAEAKPEEAL